MQAIVSKKHDVEKVADLINDAGGKVVGRTRLQKLAYLLEITGLGEGFDFEYRHYGPYSEQLANAASTAELLGFIAEEERSTAWGGTYSIFSIKVSREGTSSHLRRQLLKQLVNADPVALELAATAAFLANENDENPWKETARRKPEKARTRLEDAQRLYRLLLQINVPKPLPHTEHT